MKKIIYFLSVCFLAGMVVSSQAAAQSKEEAETIIAKSRVVIEEMLGSPDKAGPAELMKDCAGLVIIPGMLKGGFIVGGSFGNGVVLARKDGKWTGPAFVRIGAGSLGFQIGVESIDLILVIANEKTMDSFLKTSFKLGGDVAVVGGPLGVQATAATDILLKGGIYSYSRAKGLFAGLSLEGAVVGTQTDLNKAYYDVESVRSILYGYVPATPSAEKLIATVERLKP
jgi:lipid-binding SYLF domain-containing protein